ncbi:hypothetical protein BUE93_08590 [Chromobacterium amazonense]|uniref:Reverse transcriptase domain-containing protein n=1 Tax=Chromobacterium amazonense TaxID=1382803 RepID=A0A2S9X5N7_9NEIS|nr:antiviral reverse transcriptase Drt2 [Chromobacterium amazonense]PRP71003.1 hypothetical protein BUE93_08590 [Chromobacterium amazonense]
MKRSKHPWFRPRGYVHFDSPLGQAAAENLVTNPDAVATHAFYPFMRYIVETQKVNKDKATGLVLQKPPKKRPISFSAHADAHIYSYYASLLAAPYEENLRKRGLEGSILAFRSLGKSNIDFANDAFELIKEMGECVAFATDISGFFDNLDHLHLKKAWTRLLGLESLPADHYSVFRSLTKYSYVNLEDVLKTLGLSANNPPRSPERLCSPQIFREKIRGSGLVKQHREAKGIPQGSPISALLSNIYLLEFDKRLYDEITRRGGHYMRYCDDILCIVPTDNAENLFDYVDGLISEYGLDINELKTDTIHFAKVSGALKAERPLQYLGFTFDGVHKLIRSSAFAKFSDKMRRGVNLAYQTTKKHNKTRKKATRIWRQNLYERYSHLGNRNFVRYGLRAAKKMNSQAIKKQLRPLWKRLEQKIAKADEEL